MDGLSSLDLLDKVIGVYVQPTTQPNPTIMALRKPARGPIPKPRPIGTWVGGSTELRMYVCS